jgi:hypothetical protein
VHASDLKFTRHPISDRWQQGTQALVEGRRVKSSIQGSSCCCITHACSCIIAYACSRLIGCEALMHKCQIKTNYNADHLKKSIMQKMARFVMSTPSGKLLGWAVSEMCPGQNFALGYSYIDGLAAGLSPNKTCKWVVCTFSMWLTKWIQSKRWCTCDVLLLTIEC